MLPAEKFLWQGRRATIIVNQTGKFDFSVADVDFLLVKLIAMNLLLAAKQSRECFFREKMLLLFSEIGMLVYECACARKTRF